MPKDHIPDYEFRQILNWAEYAKTNEEFWQRVLLASAAYSPVAQMNVAKLVSFCMGDNLAGFKPARSDHTIERG